MTLKLVLKGGPGSGNFGHAGRPGKRGGSASGSVAASLRTGRAAAIRRGFKPTEKKPGKKPESFGEFPASKSTPISGDMAGKNVAEIIEFEDGTKGVFKPEDGMEFGSVDGEIATYEFSESIGWDLVPETVSYEKDGKTGSLQKFVVGETGMELLDEAMGGSILDYGIDGARMKVMDKLLFNTDRHAGNYIVDGDKVWAIDNGASFGDMLPGGGVDFQPSLPSGTQLFAAKANDKDTWKVYGEVAEWHRSGESTSWLSKTSHVDASRRAKLSEVLDEWVDQYDWVGNF